MGFSDKGDVVGVIFILGIFLDRNRFGLGEKNKFGFKRMKINLSLGKCILSFKIYIFFELVVIYLGIDLMEIMDVYKDVCLKMLYYSIV